ncbi:MAG: hypothetical protein KDA80_01790 [Planctomycetaceae bacterium]|nr:hypothetical protein [Planctomycetaceae bacterium]
MAISYVALIVLALVVALVISAFAMLAKHAPVMAVVVAAGVAAMLLAFVFVGYSTVRINHGPPSVVVNKFENGAIRPEPPSPPIAPEPGDHAIEPPGSSHSAKLLTPLSISETVYRDNGSTVSRTGLSTLPPWIRSENTIEKFGDSVDIYLSSQQFATVDEARAQIWPVLRNELLEFSGVDLTDGNFMSMEDALRLGIIQREADVTYPLELAGHTEEMHQVHWSTSIDGVTRELVLAQWKPAIVNQRLQHLAAGLGGATLLMGAGAFASRRRRKRAAQTA